MKLKIKNKMIFGSLAMLIAVMSISTVVVSILIYKQNKETSNEKLRQSFALIMDGISERENNLMTLSRQLATINDMGSKLSNIVENADFMQFNMLRSNYVKIAEAAYNISLKANVQKALIYDKDGTLIAYSLLDDDSISLGFIHKKSTIETATLKTNEEMNYELWKNQSSLPNNVETSFMQKIPVEESVEFKKSGKSINLVTYVPITSVAYNEKTEEMETMQFGFVSLVQGFDNKFISRLVNLTGTEINIFSEHALSLGSLDEYDQFDMTSLERTDSEGSLGSLEVVLNDIVIDGNGYFQGLLPIFDGMEPVAVITALLLKNVARSNTVQTIYFLIIISIICIVGVLPVIIIVANSITKPILKVVTGLKDMAEGEGDLTSRLEIKSSDEVGELAESFNDFIENHHIMIKEIAEKSDILTSSSNELSGLSGQMSNVSDSMTTRANTVSVSAEEMSTSMTSVAAAMEESSTNMNTVATAAEQITSTINEIAQNSENARNITGEAVTQAGSASKKVNELGDAANQVGKVTETITEISEQTNLLALNATIESARAGEAGKGFAVVANEIKELARQTAEATLEIKERINGIQDSTEGTISEINQISKVINSVNEIVTTIATAVEEQSVTTKEIASNVSQASQTIQEVNKNVAQSSTVSEEIAKNISEVNQESAEISNNSSQVNLRAEDLSSLAAELKEMVGRFKI